DVAELFRRTSRRFAQLPGGVGRGRLVGADADLERAGTKGDQTELMTDRVVDLACDEVALSQARFGRERPLALLELFGLVSPSDLQRMTVAQVPADQPWRQELEPVRRRDVDPGLDVGRIRASIPRTGHGESHRDREEHRRCELATPGEE